LPFNDFVTFLPFGKIKGVILTLPEFGSRCSAIRHLRKKGFQGRIGTIYYLPEEKIKLMQLGSDFMMHPLDEAGKQLAWLILEETQ
jgi:glutathione-regulated potassium-efflux system ancillary protein KefC